MEQAEHALMRHLGESIVRDIPGEEGWHLSWPRVHVECDYQGTAKFEDVLDIAVTVERLGGKSVTYGFKLTNQDQPVATGKVVAVCCKVKPGEPLESVAIPGDLAEKLAQFVAEV
jgi:acyl-CoA thioesterase FadM